MRPCYSGIVTEIERLYRQRIAEQSGREGVARVEALFAQVRDMLRRRFAAAHPEISERALRKQVAQALYRTDRQAQRLPALWDE